MNKLDQVKRLLKEINEEIDLEEPYIVNYELNETSSYNSKYGDDRLCKCGHPYYRHFDTYDDMAEIGCKYCQCFTFKEVK